MLPYIFPHLRNTHRVIRMDVNVLDLDVIFGHINQDIISSLTFTKIIIKADKTDFVKKTYG